MKVRNASIFIAVFMILCSFSINAQNLIVNGDFEAGATVTNSRQLANVPGWSSDNYYYGQTQLGNASNYISHADLFEIGGPCIGMNGPDYSLNIPDNKWTVNLPPFGNSGSRYAGGFGSSDPSVILLSYGSGELCVGSLNASLLPNQEYDITFNHAPGDGFRAECNPPLVYITPSSRSLQTQQMWITLRTSFDHSNGLLVRKVILSPQVGQWGSYVAKFTLTQAEAAIGWDRVEFLMRNTASTDPEMKDNVYFLDNAVMEEGGPCGNTINYFNINISDYCITPITSSCEMFKWNDLTQQFEASGQTISDAGIYEERCYDVSGCLETATTYNVELLSPTFEFLTLYDCNGGYHWYTPDGLEFDSYHLRGLSGPNSGGYEYSSHIGSTDAQGNPYNGWISHPFLAGGRYEIEFYNYDANGDPTCLTRTLTIDVVDGSVTCPEDEEHYICEGQSLVLGGPPQGTNTHRWLDGASNELGNGELLFVAPTTSTTYTLEITNEFGCSCVTSYHITVEEIGCYPILKDQEICLSEVFCTDFLTDCGYDEFLEKTTNININFGDGTQLNFNYFPSSHRFENCYIYGSSGVYTVTYTFDLPCGQISTSAQVVVNPSITTNCVMNLSQLEYDNLPPQVDLFNFQIAPESNCCPELHYSGTWYDSQGSEIVNFSAFDKTLLTNGTITKKYVNPETCEICILTLLGPEGPESVVQLGDNESKGKSAVNDPFYLQENQEGLFEIDLVPNPNTGVFLIRNSGYLEAYEYVSIISPNGQIIFEEKNVNTSRAFDISKSPNGVYIIIVQSEGQIEKIKLILQK